MKSVIYYFTGTGNSLAAAKKMAAAIEECQLVPIASLERKKGKIVPDAERVGIICPVYFCGLPDMVASFAGRLDLSRVKYTFSIVTLGGTGGSSALRQLDGILKKQFKRGLNAGFMVKMPGNYILIYESPGGKKQEQILAAADERLHQIGEILKNFTNTALPYSPLAQVFYILVYHRFRSRVHQEDRKFSVSDECTSCGTCKEICPAGNIDLIDGRPVWKHNCELCCGCIHACPVKAIQAGNKTAGRLRYRNPEIKVSEIKQRMGK